MPSHTKYLLCPLNENGEPELPPSLGLWNHEKDALKHAIMLVDRDKQAKGYFISKVTTTKRISRSWEITAYRSWRMPSAKIKLGTWFEILIWGMLSAIVVFGLYWLTGGGRLGL